MTTTPEREPTALAPDAGDAPGDGDLSLDQLARDISERKLIQAELEIVAERYRLFVEHSTEGIARIELREPLDTSLEVEAQVAHLYEHAFLAEANDALVEMYGLPPADLIVGFGFEVIFPLDDPGAQDDVRNFIRNGYVTRNQRSDNLNPEGVRKTFEWDVTGIVRDGFSSEAWFRIRDVTEQQRLGEELEQARRMDAVGVLAAGLAHDFNNLLTVISLNLGAAEDAESDAAAPFLATAKHALDNAAELAQQMLSIGSRTEAIRHAIQLRPQVDDVVELLRRSISPDIAITVDIADDIHLVASPLQLQHVILNLLSNASEAMPEGGQLNIRASMAADATPHGLDVREKGYVTIEVQDSGLGMAPETVARIFEPYFTTRRGSGHGLGLAVVYGIVQEHHGTITVTSEPGAGTTFTIWFPASSQEDAASTQWGQPAGDRTTDPATRFMEAIAGPDETAPAGAGAAAVIARTAVLVVDDRADVREICREVLEHNGFTITEAEEGAEALRMLETGPLPAVVLIDVTMPGMSGPEAVVVIRQRYPGVTPVLMSGYSEDVVGAALLKEGVRLLRKPFSNAELVETVRASLAD
ncbi:MAG: ATP-binding protein [Dehalococcoidia bacterium]